MKNVKYTFYWTAKEDKSALNNNYNKEADDVVCEAGFSFADYLRDCLEVQYEQEDNSYYLLDDEGERTGECYLVVSEEETDEEI